MVAQSQCIDLFGSPREPIMVSQLMMMIRSNLYIKSLLDMDCQTTYPDNDECQRLCSLCGLKTSF